MKYLTLLLVLVSTILLAQETKIELPTDDNTASFTIHGADTRKKMKFFADGGFYMTGEEYFGEPSITGAGNRLMWYQGKSAFRAGYVNNSQWDYSNLGPCSFAAGMNTTARYSYSGVFGAYSTVCAYSLALGYGAKSIESYSIAAGYNTLADGEYATAVGYGTETTGYYAASFGFCTSSMGREAVAMGHATKAGGDHCIAMGYHTESSEEGIAFGNSTTAEDGISMGISTLASGSGAVAMGIESVASGGGATAMGDHTQASGGGSTAMGFCTAASGNNSTAMGYRVQASGVSSVSIGRYTTAGGIMSTAMGSYCSTSGRGSFIVGDASTSTVMDCTIGHRMQMRFSNGYYFYTDSSCTIGARLGGNSNSWASISDSTKKENFSDANGEHFLNSISKLKLGSWNYKGQEKEHGHYGPMAQEIFQYFGKDEYGTIGNDTTLASADMDGIMMIALKALEKRTSELKRMNEEVSRQNEKVKHKNTEIMKENDELTLRISKLEKMFELVTMEKQAGNKTEVAISGK